MSYAELCVDILRTARCKIAGGDANSQPG